MEHIIYGRNSVMEALKGNRTIEKIFTLRGQNEGSIIKILGMAKRKDIVIQEVERTKLDELSNEGKHQGVVAYVATHEYSSVQDIMDEARQKKQDPFIIILDGIQDPHNLGAIIRTAHNAGAHGIIIPKHRAVGLTSTVSKASAGAIEYMKIARVTNIAQTIDQLKKANVWVACADMDGKPLYKTNLKGAIAVVIGNEGSGVSPNIKSKCDFNVCIPMYGQIASLNASVACAIVCYEVVRQTKF
ncbi:23S rRNA (guanosine(2251)-2'-O)-methyltransferase RlmB [Candidatus Epulonipiscium fishelsonii]|uniref:23S rRNA (Guanosine(2251)-2'-O)-methyltransferase RlmB n=1 Tax=Candidatus Epulonipiscium fishelsonii TaxID=77094 RepID=A0ACC8XE70_9FIRM|nr:23S rRNA (guanosine(2251)-2'-O)-methyltransferase RlmB [Epulopiscium sp. SCG-B05WGA-EpuloA1]ONI41093.1 23S rRNA (guanosine(2251)-2'-O)-methyltransferase RlmB [Epulopiscium sp. SCG-B11WGA-EpuloA1]